MGPVKSISVGLLIGLIIIGSYHLLEYLNIGIVTFIVLSVLSGYISMLAFIIGDNYTCRTILDDLLDRLGFIVFVIVYLFTLLLTYISLRHSIVCYVIGFTIPFFIIRALGKPSPHQVNE